MLKIFEYAMFVLPMLPLLFAIWLVRYLHVSYSYWKRRNVYRTGKCGLRVLWSYLTNWRLSSHMMQLYETCRKERWPCVGSFLITRPVLFVASPKLLKEIVVKNQWSFRNRGSYHNGESLEDFNLFNMKDEMWCKWRKIMATCFAPNGKMKEYTKTFEKYMKKSLKELDALKCKNGMVTVDFFLFSNGYACAVAQHLFLGVEMRSESCKALDAVFRPALWNKLTDILSYYWPKLLRLVRATEFPRAANEFVKEALKTALRSANLPEESFIRQVMDFKDTDELIQDENVVGVLSALFIGGLKSTTPLLTYACYELAKAPDVQEKLRAEILNSLDDDGSISFESSKRLTYMQCVLNEVMRLHNGGPLIIRECNQTCTIESIDLTVEEGVLVIGSLRGILMDKDYFCEPEIFNPDRFMSPLTHRDAFLPFGIGRHSCIGNKFALFQAKTFLTSLLSNYYLAVNENTLKTFKDKSVRLAENAIYLNIVPLEHIDV